MLRIFKNKIFLLVLVTVLLFVVIGIAATGGIGRNPLGDIISIPLTPIQKLFTATGQKINSFFLFFRDINALKQENEQLKSRLTELEKQNSELKIFEEKNKELRLALNLKAQFEDYDTVGANVIAKDPGNWFNIFRIDRGEKDGIKEGFTVVTAGKSLVGRILETDLTSSKVISIIDEDSVVSGWISKPGGGHVIIRGDIELKESGYCRMDYIPQDVDVLINDTVETSGLGGVFPKGIYIGKVREVRKAEDDLERYAIIEPAVNLKKLEEVFILKNR